MIVCLDVFSCRVQEGGSGILVAAIGTPRITFATMLGYRTRPVPYKRWLAWRLKGPQIQGAIGYNARP